MALLPAKCPECGGFVEVDNEKRLGVCQHCGQPFVIEEAIQIFNTRYNITNNYSTTNNYGDGAVVNVYEDKSKDFVIEGGVLKKYQGESIEVVIPGNVIEIGENCFKGLKIKSVIIPDSVTIIGASAFCDCTNLTSIKIPDGVTLLNIDAFKGCTNLSSITIPKKVMSFVRIQCPTCGGMLGIGNNKNIANCQLCGGNYEIKELVKNYITSYNNAVVNIFEDKSDDFVISEGTLMKYRGVSADVVIPDGVVKIGGSCFKDFKITSVIIPDTVTSIGDYAFSGCTNLASITIGNSVTSIGEEAFSYCESLTSVVIPNSVTNIGESAFTCCKNLKSVTIPDSVKTIGKAAFCDYWISKDLCSLCGGELKGLFSKKCVKCGKSKLY